MCSFAEVKAQTREGSGSRKTTINSMMVRNEHHVDTLTLLDRLAIRTNTFDWLLLVPNIGFEFDVKGRNWNRWTVGASFRGNWQTSHTYKPSMVYNLREARLEGRQYWRTRDMGYIKETGNYSELEPHKHYWDKAVSIRRKKSRYPSFTFFRGIYASYGDYSLKLFETGWQGTAVQAGVTWGFVTNLYGFQNGNSLDLEVGISAGAMYTKNTEYVHDPESDCYPIQKINDWHLVKYPILNDLSVTLVYRLGKYPSLWKYRYRDDVDSDYEQAKRDRRMTNETNRKNDRLYRTMKDSISREFWHVYDEYVRTHPKASLPDRPNKNEKAQPQKDTEDENIAKQPEGEPVQKEEEATPQAEEPAQKAEEPTQEAGKEADDHDE